MAVMTIVRDMCLVCGLKKHSVYFLKDRKIEEFAPSKTLEEPDFPLFCCGNGRSITWIHMEPNGRIFVSDECLHH